jgi:poly(A) polymerase
MTAQELCQELVRLFAGRQLYLVGGSLRDQLLGREGKDLDFATDARPEETRERVAKWADAVWVVGEKFGTVGLSKRGLKAEITTLRAERYDGVSRKPEVSFGLDIVEDLSRRDFTINAIARDLHRGELLDPFGGRQDLEAGIARFVGDPQARIAEDPLRMLRAVRFCAQLGFELDPAGTVAIAQAAGELARISWERIRDELDGILLSPRPANGVRLMIDLGLARHVLPELLTLRLPEPARYHLKEVLEHTLDALEFTPADKLLRYAALLHDIAKPETYSSDESGLHFYGHEKIGAERARAILTRLRQPAAFVEDVSRLVSNHLRVPSYRSEWSLSAVRRLMFDLGDQLQAAIALAQADVRASDPADYPEFQARLRELQARIREVGDAVELARMKPLLNGQEVMALLGMGPGPKVGEVLQFLLGQQIEGRITTREQAEQAVRRRFGEGHQAADERG